MNDKIILHLCAEIGSDSKPYKDAGYNVILVGKDKDVRLFSPPANVYGIIANPVCTDFSIAKNSNKDCAAADGLELVNACMKIIKEVSPKFWMIENPATGKLKHHLGSPQHQYEPWQYGSAWTKKTACWGNFNIPSFVYSSWEDVPKIPELYIRPGRHKPSIVWNHKNSKRFIREFDCFEVKNDSDFRSLCPQTFARAFFEVNQ